MSKVLTCSICARRQTVGIMSAQSWGAVNNGSVVARACPECQLRHLDWRDQLSRMAHESSQETRA